MLITPQEWIERRFGDAKKKPHPSSVRRWIENGVLPGKKIGGRFYVEIDDERNSTGDELVDRVLRAG
ncbi:MAG TPA: hypothetical protein VIK82_09875 [Porticoccaceae bacterium]